MHEIVLPKFHKEYREACVIEGEEVLTLRFGEREEHGNSFFNTGNFSKGKWVSPLMEEDWVVLCQVLCQSIGKKNGLTCTKGQHKCASTNLFLFLKKTPHSLVG